MQLPAAGRRASPGSSRPTGPRRRRAARGAEVREHEHADGVAVRYAARAADPALPAEAAHPGSRADCALGERPAGGAVHRDRDVAALDVHGARVAEPAVVTLAHDGDHELLDADERVVAHGQLDGAVVDAPHRMRRGQVDRRLEQPPLPDLKRARELAGAVQHGHPGRQAAAPAGTSAVTPVRATPRPSGGSGSSRHTVTWPTRTPDVRDRVAQPRLELTDPQAQLAQPRAAWIGRAVAHGRTVESPRGARHAGRLERPLPAARAARRDLGRRSHARDRDARRARAYPRRARGRALRRGRARTTTRRSGPCTTRRCSTTSPRLGRVGAARASPTIPASTGSSRTSSPTAGLLGRAPGDPAAAMARSRATSPTTR